MEDYEIVNLSLDLVAGGRDAKVINSLTQGTKTAELCGRWYDTSRIIVIKRGYFQECIDYAECEETSDDIEMADYDDAFDLPDDYLALIRQCHESSIESEYRCEVKGNYLLSNNYTNDDGDAAYIKYKWDNEDPDTYSEELIECIAVRLAANLAPSIIGGDKGQTRRHYLLEEFEKLILPVNNSVSQSVQYKRDLYRHNFPILGGRTRK